MISRKEKQRILLVNPPHHRLYKDTYSTNRYPIGLGYLAGMIKSKTDWGVMVYNADFVQNSELGISHSYATGTGFKNYLRNLGDLSNPIWEEVRKTIADYSPMVVGIYCCAASFVSAGIVAKIAKELSQKTIVVLGGPHPTAVGKDVLKEPNIDIAVRGEGELTILELLDAIGKGAPLDKVRGIAYRVYHETVETPERECINDLDSLCFPYKNAPEVLKDFEKYPKSAFREIFVSRGCPYNCFFCGSRYVLGRKLRLRSVANVLEEIESLRRIGLTWIEFGDDTFGADKEYTRQLCDSLIRECPGILWGCLTRVDLIDEQTIALMKKAGCRSIDIGIESGNNEMLKKIRKGITIEQAVAAANMIRRHGIRLTANFIIGFPEETEKTLNDTFAAMKKIKGRLVYNIFTPYPGTEAFEYCRRNGLVNDDFNISLYNHQSPENCFCLNIRKERFRELASEIEKSIDKHNAKQDLRSILSLGAWHKIRDYGFSGSLRKLFSAIRSL
jgi:tRNA A37 methylthiotransferase MiaB